MKKVFKTLSIVLAIGFISGCNFLAPKERSSKNNSEIENDSSQVDLTSTKIVPVNEDITLINPTDTSMVTDKVKSYIDAMREQEEHLDEPYKYNAIEGNGFVSVEDYLDEGEVEGQNRTVNGKIPNRSDKNMGVTLSYELSEELEAEDPKTRGILLADNEYFENAKTIYTHDTSVHIDNLFVNTQYYWKVVVGNKESEVGTFTTGDYPRWMTCRSLTGVDDGRGIFNVRDLGGYMTESGSRVKQGLVFRGGEITTMNGNGHYNTITDIAKNAFRKDMGMVGGVELDLRGPSDISDGYKACAFAENGDIEYKQYAIKSYEQTFTQTRSMVAPIFEILKEADEKPVYFHCFGGADRTGTLGFLLNGLLGVSYTDLVIDFELTSYSSINNEHIRNHMNGHQHQYDRWPALINQIKTDTTGGYKYDENALLKDNIENFLVKACSVPQATIDTIRDIMLED